MSAAPSYDAVASRADDVTAAAEAVDFAAVVSLHETPLLRYVGRLAGAEHAEDLVQEAFLRLFRQLRRHGQSSVRKTSVWLFRVVRNLALDARRRRRTRESARQVVRENGRPVEEPPAGLDALVRRAACERAVDELQHLPERQREVLLLKVVHEMSLTEIAEITGRTVGNAGYHLNQGLRELARRLKAAGVM